MTPSKLVASACFLTLALGSAPALAQSRGRPSPPRNPSAGRPAQPPAGPRAVPRSAPYPGQRYPVYQGGYRGPHGYGPYRYRPYYGYRPYYPYYGYRGYRGYYPYYGGYYYPYGYYPYYGSGFSFGVNLGYSYGWPNYGAGYTYAAPYSYPAPYATYAPAYSYSNQVVASPPNQGAVRLLVTPRDADVFVDGGYAGRVSDFDGTSRPLVLDAGPHRIEIRAAGYEVLTFDLDILPGQTIRYGASLRPGPP